MNYKDKIKEWFRQKYFSDLICPVCQSRRNYYNELNKTPKYQAQRREWRKSQRGKESSLKGHRKYRSNPENQQKERDYYWKTRERQLQLSKERYQKKKMTLGGVK